MSQTKHNLTRRIQIFKNEAEQKGMTVMPTLDYVLQAVVAVKFGFQNEIAEKYCGHIETAWCNGGFREPNGFKEHNMIAECVNIKSFIDDLKKTVPSGYSGKAIFRMNGGEVIGRPALMP